MCKRKAGLVSPVLRVSNRESYLNHSLPLLTVDCGERRDHRARIESDVFYRPGKIARLRCCRTACRAEVFRRLLCTQNVQLAFFVLLDLQTRFFK